jgi:hypothetical protein
MPKIEKLTPEEEALIPIVRDEWLKIGLATGPADRAAAQAAISDTYRAAGLEPPHRWIWFGSPWAGWISTVILSKLADIGTPVKYKVADQVQDRLFYQVRSQVKGRVRAHVSNQLAEVSIQVWDQVGDQVRSDVIGEIITKNQGKDHAEAWDYIREMGLSLGC